MKRVRSIKQNGFDFEADPLQSKFEAHVREFIERLFLDFRHEDSEALLETGEKTQASTRCHHDVVEFLANKLPRHEAALYRLLCWYMLRILFVAFEERLTGLLPHEDVVEAQAHAALKNFVREIKEPDPEEN